MESILEIKNLKKDYKGFSLKDVSFQLPRGFIMGLIGPNGAGKTTCIKLIMNLLRRDGGQIKIFGKDNVRDEVEIKENIGFVYDSPCFYEYLTIKRMKNVIAPFYRNWDEQLFTKFLADFELSPNQKIETLSRGMRMKFALAVALSHHAELIVMDEPTSGLDPVFRRELLEILMTLIQDERKSILFSTHITSDLERVADYITFLNKGEVVTSCSRDELLENWGVVKGRREHLTAENDGLLVGVRRREYGFVGLTADKEAVRRELPGDVLIEKPTLEDIMFYTAKGEKNV
jgi:ABC-2 type transport system ATP-binding protein